MWNIPYISNPNITMRWKPRGQSDLKAAFVSEKPNLDIVQCGLSVVASSWSGETRKFQETMSAAGTAAGFKGTYRSF